jgi:hypothetical protein
MAFRFIAGLQLLLNPCDRAQPSGVQALSRLFISHSSLNDDWALALQAWLIREGWSDEEDIFLDLDPERGRSPANAGHVRLKMRPLAARPFGFSYRRCGSPRNGAATSTNSPTDSIRNYSHC